MTLTFISLSSVVSFQGRVQVKIEYSIFLDGCKENALIRGLAPQKKEGIRGLVQNLPFFHHKTGGNCVTTFPFNRALFETPYTQRHR